MREVKHNESVDYMLVYSTCGDHAVFWTIEGGVCFKHVLDITRYRNIHVYGSIVPAQGESAVMAAL